MSSLRTHPGLKKRKDHYHENHHPDTPEANSGGHKIKKFFRFTQKRAIYEGILDLRSQKTTTSKISNWIDPQPILGAEN